MSNARGVIWSELIVCSDAITMDDGPYNYEKKLSKLFATNNAKGTVSSVQFGSDP